MGRDHSIPCAKCGTHYAGMLGLSVCGCDKPRSDSSRIYPGPSCEHTERIAEMERHIADLSRRVAELMIDTALDRILPRVTEPTRTPRPSKRGKGRRK